MLLDDKQVALNDIVVACQESIDHYADAIERIDDPALRELFERVRAERRESVERLGSIIRRSGELPRAPYADREELHKLVTHVKAALPGNDARTVFVNDRIDGERRIEGLVEAASRLDFSADTQACLRTLRERVGDVIARLATHPDDH